MRDPKEYHVPPKDHLRKARARLERLKSVGVQPSDLALGRKHQPDISTRKSYSIELEFVLRDYERILEGLEGPEQN